MNDKREIAFKDLKLTSTIGFELFNDDCQQTWDDFIWQSNNGSIFQTRRFLNYHPPDRFRDFSLIFKKEGKNVALFPAAFKNQNSESCLISHPGASMGGLIFNYEVSLKDTFRVVEKLVEVCKAESISKLIITLPPEIYHTRPSNYLDFALLESGFTYVKREITSVIPLDFSEEDTLLIFSPEARRATRRALKSGVQVRESSDFSSFYVILEKNLKMRHNVKPTHTLDELNHLHEIYPEYIKLFGAFVENMMIAGIVIFKCNSKVALAFYISHNEDMQKYRGVNLLFYEVIRWSVRNQFKFLDFGIFTVDMKPNWGLARFKESFGAQGVFRDTLMKTF